MIIAVDFDGTLFENKYPDVGLPIFKVINYCKDRKAVGDTLILWTCRSGKDLDTALKACSDVELYFDYINENTRENLEKYGKEKDSRKIFADIYIDDRCISINEIKEII